MTRFLSATPILAYADLAGGIAFWCDRLGWQERFVLREDGVRPVFAVLGRDAVALHAFSLDNDVVNGDGRFRAGVGAVAFRVDGIADLHQRCVAAGIAITICDLTSGKHGLGTFTIADAEGNRITFEETMPDAG